MFKRFHYEVLRLASGQLAPYWNAFLFNILFENTFDAKCRQTLRTIDNVGILLQFDHG